MGAIVKACNITTSVKNTGKECDSAMLATAMLIAIQKDVTFTDLNLADPVTWLTGLIQQRKAFPLFGQTAPVRSVNNAGGEDQTVTLDDGLIVFMRYQLYNRILETTSGGLCYASALQSFLNSGYSIIEIDQAGQMMARKNADGTYSGLYADYMYAPSPTMADFTSTPYKNRFSYSYSPIELVNNGIIFKGAAALLSMVGLIDVRITKSAAATVTKLKLKVNTDCKGTSLVGLFPSAIADLDLYIVTNVATGVVIVPSAGAVVLDTVELTGTFVSGQTYNVIGSTPQVWQTNLIEGYDAAATSGSAGVNILIP